MIYNKYGKRAEPNPTANFTFVVLLVTIGLSIVLAIPYCLLRGRRAAAKGTIASSFAQMVQQSRKTAVGHYN